MTASGCGRLLLAFMLMFVVPASAAAHTSVVESAPASDSLIQVSPERLTLSFSGAIDVAPSVLQVFGPRGTVVSVGAPTASGRQLSVPVMAAGNGSYAAAWRVVAADGQPQTGVVEYHLGTRSSSPVARQQAQASLSGDGWMDSVLLLSRWALLAVTLIALGAAVFSTVLAATVNTRVVRACLVGIAIFSLSSFLLHAAYAQGLPLHAVLDPRVVVAEAQLAYGAAALIRVGLVVFAFAAVGWLGARSRTRRLVALSPFLAIAATLALPGHMATAGGVPLVATTIHVVAAAAWVGTLVHMARLRPHGQAASRDVARRYSELALASVMVLAATGAYLAFLQTRLSWTAMSGTGYGQLLGAKAMLVAGALLLALLNRAVWLPRVDASPNAWRMLRRFAWGELAVLGGAAAVTAALIQSAPPATTQLPPGTQRIIARTTPVALPVSVKPAPNDRITIESAASGALEVMAVGARPYARITPAGTHLNLAAPGRNPRWERLSGEPRLTYHDYRLPMLGALPDSIDVRNEQRQRVLSWQLPIRYDGRPMQLQATVYFTPSYPDDPSPETLFVLSLVLIAGMLTVRRRRREHASARQIETPCPPPPANAVRAPSQPDTEETTACPRA